MKNSKKNIPPVLLLVQALLLFGHLTGVFQSMSVGFVAFQTTILIGVFFSIYPAIGVLISLIIGKNWFMILNNLIEPILSDNYILLWLFNFFSFFAFIFFFAKMLIVFLFIIKELSSKRKP